VKALLWFAASALLASLAVALYLRLARRRGWLDTPNHRSSHEQATPSSGGIAVMLVFLPLAGAQLLLQAFGDSIPSVGFSAPGALAASLFMAALLCVIGAWDDRSFLPAGLRLVLFLGLAMIAAIAWLMPQGSWSLSVLMQIGGCALALAWLVNLFNFMDGIDGLAALQCVIVALALAALGAGAGACDGFIVLALTLAGSYLGFLLFNWPPARLFMGDAGSLSAGFLLGLLGLWGWREGWLPAAVWLLLMSPFLIDTTWTLLSRMLRRVPLAQAHREHAYQRLARHWHSHRLVLLALLALHAFWLLPLSWLQLRQPQHAQTILLLGIFPQLFLMVRLRRLK
jgi:Fuc2NAc and GlcNAc transferase